MHSHFHFAFLVVPGLLTILTTIDRGAIAQADDNASIELRISVPGNTHKDAQLYLSGNRPELGNWDGKGALAIRESDGIYLVELNLPTHANVEYKITRGSWETVEKSVNGSDIPNRTLIAAAGKKQSITVAEWADSKLGSRSGPATRSTATGDIHYHEAFHSSILGNDRRLIVWLPPGYREDLKHRFPVLYLHDGESCFDASTSYDGHELRADKTAGVLIRAGKIRPLIMVAVANSHIERVYEYTPSKVDDKTNGVHGGGGEKYAQFLITEVKPFIDRTYRTLPDRDHTAVAGASLGGLSSLYLGLKHPW